MQTEKDDAQAKHPDLRQVAEIEQRLLRLERRFLGEIHKSELPPIRNEEGQRNLDDRHGQRPMELMLRMDDRFDRLERRLDRIIDRNVHAMKVEIAALKAAQHPSA